ncbi:DUF4244 domain-containing protein [Kineococcus esterisolvens]|uniref:DUF4244 domain-containing protein n=1 Tax=unclassified Kineococcus TaxID=2621656 RepID=UPI003D7E28B8
MDERVRGGLRGGLRGRGGAGRPRRDRGPEVVEAPVAAARGRVAVAGHRTGDEGMATAEYAMATLAACGFAGLLIAVLRSDEVRGLLLGVVRQALALG